MDEWHLEESTDSSGRKYYHYEARRSSGLAAKLKVWGFVLAGIMLGTALFLFFLTVFVYVFLPIAALFILYSLVRRFFSR